MHLDPDPRPYDDVDVRAVACIRGIAMDAIAKANSGHSGTAMALAPLAHVLWTRVLRFDPADPTWADRDRFVLSCGHASILQYAMLHLAGYELSIDDLRAFRQLESRTPGHPERGHVPGVEVTTGPLGQGFANAVGLAWAQRYKRAQYGADLVDHRTFVFASDGDMQEGLSHEAASFAGHQQLGHLVVVYDDNHITIDGDTERSFSEDVGARFEAYGWAVERLGHVGEDFEALEAALRRGGARHDQPTLLVLRTDIGFPSPNLTGTAKAHGEVFPATEIAATKAILGLDPTESFVVEPAVAELYRQCHSNGRDWSDQWRQRLDRSENGPAYRRLLDANSDLSEVVLPRFELGESIATRVAAGKALNAVVDALPGVIAGSADLTNNTGVSVASFLESSHKEPAGRQVYFGIREHAMAAIANGIAAHGGLHPVVSTFFVFADYMRPAIRLAALQQLPVTFWFTHDSLGVGEDGPTHQPVEQLASLRIIPDLIVLRPADANECVPAVMQALAYDGPTAIVLSRQNIPVVADADLALRDLSAGAYVVSAPETLDPDVVLIGTGAEVSVAVAAAEILRAENLDVSVVSMPSWELFASQDEDYVSSVLPDEVPRIAVEAGVSFGWERYADAIVSVESFGASGHGASVLEAYGITAAEVAQVAREILSDLESMIESE
jgi:transketolase